MSLCLKEWITENSNLLWLGIFTFWVLGDFTATFVGLEYLNLTESNPIVLAILNDSYGLFFLTKIGTFMLIYGITNRLSSTWYVIYTAYFFLFTFVLNILLAINLYKGLIYTVS